MMPSNKNLDAKSKDLCKYNHRSIKSAIILGYYNEK
jgi:hypothetical protein